MPRLEDFIGSQAPGGRRARPGDFGTGAGLEQLGRAVGQVGDVLEQFAKAEITQRVNAEAAEVRAELNELLDDPLLTPEQFEKDSKEIVKQHQATLPFPRTKADFSLKVAGLVDRGLAQVRGAEMKRLADAATAHLDRMQQRLTDEFGQATTQVEKAEIIDEFLHNLEIAQQTRVIGHVDRFNREQAFLKEGLGGDIRQAIREATLGPPEDAADAVQGLLDGTLGRGLPDADVQAWLRTATNAYESDLRKRAARVVRLSRIEKDRVIAEHKRATNTLDGFLDLADRSTGEEKEKALADFAESFLADFDLFSKEEKEFYRDREREGGGLGGGETDPLIYNQFYSLASAGRLTVRRGGPFLTDEIDKAYREGNLNRAARDNLFATQDDRRFGDAERFLKRALQVGETAFGRDDFIPAQKTAQALQEFTDWKIENPRASREDAQKFAERLARAAGIEELIDIESANLRPFWAVVDDPNRPFEINVPATRAATKRQYDDPNNPISFHDYDTQIHWINRIQRAQELRNSGR